MHNILYIYTNKKPYFKFKVIKMHIFAFLKRKNLLYPLLKVIVNLNNFSGRIEKLSTMFRSKYGSKQSHKVKIRPSREPFFLMVEGKESF